MGLEMQVCLGHHGRPLITWASIWLNPAKSRPSPAALGNQNPRGPGDRRRLHDVARPQDELINPARRRQRGSSFFSSSTWAAASCASRRSPFCAGRTVVSRVFLADALGRRRRVNGALPCCHQRLKLLDLARPQRLSALRCCNLRLGPQFRPVPASRAPLTS